MNSIACYPQPPDRPITARGPQQHTLHWWVTTIDDPDLWQPNGTGNHILQVPKAVLAAKAGITAGSLTSRLATLRRAELIQSTNPLVVRTDRLRELASPTVVPIRRRTDRLRDHLEQAGYQHQPAAHGYVDPDGRRATIAELANLTGRSTGTIQHHLTRQRATTNPAPNPDDSVVLAAVERLTTLVIHSAEHHPAALAEQIARYATAATELLIETIRGKRDPQIAYPADTAENTAEKGSEFEIELNFNSSQTRDDPKVGPETRGSRPQTRDSDAVPAVDRAGQHSDGQLDEQTFRSRFVAPLIAAHSRLLPNRPTLVLGPPTFAAASGWPADLLDIARDRLVADMADHPDQVDNWGGLITVVLREGRTRYLPLERPPTAEQLHRQDLEQQTASWLARIATMDPEDADALLDSTLARTNPELHATLKAALQPTKAAEVEGCDSTSSWRDHLGVAKSRLGSVATSR